MNNELLREFLLESFENLANISEELTSFEKNNQDFELLNSIFRKVHTLKGSAGFLGFKKLQEVTHVAESLLDLIRERNLEINPQIVDCLLEVFDVSLEILRNIEVGNSEPVKNYSSIIQKTIGLMKPQNNIVTDELAFMSRGVIPKGLLEDNPDENKSTNDKNKPNESSLEVVEKSNKSKLGPSLNQVEPQVQQVKVLTKDNNSSVPVANPEISDLSQIKNSAVTDSVVRVNVHLLDKIMNVVGELVLNRNQILQFSNTLNSAELTKLSQQLNTITTELQADIMTTRMQPVGSVLSKFERIVRDLAKSQNKLIRLEIIGKETELDKTLLEAIRDPLTHLIRNSIDHGIELPEARRERGKVEEGKIVIRSYHESGQISIEIKDDGNGIDPQKIASKAIQKGILTAEQVKTMSPKQILNIIFMPGFSTAEEVTNISGRGVGMDVVKSNVEKIGGSVDIISEVGQGSTFKLKIPLTLAIVPALVVQDSSETFAIPQISLVELVRFDTTNGTSKIEKLYGAEFYRLRGSLIPVFRLSQNLELLGKKSTSEFVDSDSVNIVVLNAEGKTYGLIVDLILDTEEIVVKPLSKQLKNLNFYAGATIMGDGRVALILDAVGFYNLSDKGVGLKIDKINDHLDTIIKVSGDEGQELLICELGDNRHYAIPLILVNRLEEFPSSKIEWSGDRPLVKYGEHPMPLVNLEASLKLRGESLLLKMNEIGNYEVPCVVVNIRNHLFGFVVKDIIDIQHASGAIHSDSVDRKGLLGTVFLKNETITILDVHSILEEQAVSKKIFQKKLTGNGTILLVDDSPLFLKILKDFLLDIGYQVHTATNGKEAIELLNSGTLINLIVTDIEMPVLNGWDLATSIRKSNQQYSRIPIIAMSSKASNLDIEKGLKCGFNEQVEKMDNIDLKNKIQEFI